MQTKEKLMLKCKTCGKEYLIDDEELIKVNGVYGIYCKDSCGAFVDVKEMAQGKEKHVDLRCSKCNTPLDSNKVNNAVLECPHCHEKMTFTKIGQTHDVINTINLGKAELSICNFDSAYKYFDEAIKKDPNEPEAYFGKVLAEYNIQYLRDFSHFKEEGTNGIVLQPICYQENIENIRNDSNYKKAIELASEEQKKVYEQKLKEIEEIHKYFLELEKKKLNYDCFICVKVSENNNGKYTQDSIYASKLYDKLKEYGYHPFYSEKEKEKNGGWLGNIYEANILYGLYKSKCMIIVCSDKDYLDTQWVKSEYSRYIALMKSSKKPSNSLCVAYIKDVIEKLPGISYRLEGIKFNEFDSSERIINFVEQFCSLDNQKKSEIESIKIEYGSVAKKATKISQRNIEYYELGSNSGAKLTIDADNKFKIALQLLNNKLFSDAEKHLSDIIKYNDNNGDARVQLIISKMKMSTIDQMLDEDNEEKFIPYLEEFDKAIKTASKEVGLKVINIFDKLCRKCAEVDEFDNSEAFFRFVINYKYDGNYELRDFFLNYITSFSKSKRDAERKYEFFNKYIVYIDNKDVDKHIRYRLNMQKSLINSGCFDSAKHLNKEINEIDEGNINNYWCDILIHNRSQNYESILSTTEVDEYTYNVLERALRYSVDIKQYCDIVDKFISISFNELTEENYSKKLAIFDRTIRYYPPASINNIVRQLSNLADVLIAKSLFDESIKYCNIALGYQKDDYKMYWRVVLSKLKAHSNDEIIESTTRVGKIPEFSMALSCAKDDKFVDSCLEVAKDQEKYNRELCDKYENLLKGETSEIEKLNKDMNVCIKSKNDATSELNLCLKKLKKIKIKNTLVITFSLVIYLILCILSIINTPMVISIDDANDFQLLLPLVAIYFLYVVSVLLPYIYDRNIDHLKERLAGLFIVSILLLITTFILGFVISFILSTKSVRITVEIVALIVYLVYLKIEIKSKAILDKKKESILHDISSIDSEINCISAKISEKNKTIINYQEKIAKLHALLNEY